MIIKKNYSVQILININIIINFWNYLHSKKLIIILLVLFIYIMSAFYNVKTVSPKN